MTTLRNEVSEMGLIPISQIYLPPDPVREWTSDEEFESLLGSIEKRGVLQPVVLKRRKPKPDDRFHKQVYTLVTGRRRYRAVELISKSGKATIPAIVLSSNLPKEEAEAIAVDYSTNEFQKKWSITERLKALDRLKKEHKFVKQKEIAKFMGVSESYISNLVKVSKSPEPEKEYVKLASKDGRSVYMYKGNCPACKVQIVYIQDIDGKRFEVD